MPSTLDCVPSPDPGPEARAASRERRIILDQLLAEVCRDWKDSIIVHDYLIGSLAANEISDKYGLSEDLIYQRARRLRVRLLKWLEARGITSAEQLLAGAAGIAPR
jgi:DNA-directed RNA polymerase specialized sigma24 family protein